MHAFDVDEEDMRRLNLQPQDRCCLIGLVYPDVIQYARWRQTSTDTKPTAWQNDGLIVTLGFYRTAEWMQKSCLIDLGRSFQPAGSQG